MAHKTILNPLDFLSRLSAEERISLACALRSLPPCQPVLKEGELIKAAICLLERAKNSAPAYSNARWRMWFIFMFLRHAGLKLSELLCLRENNLDFARGQIRAGEKKRQRNIPLAPDICRLLRSRWQEWGGKFASGTPLACDTSLIRRTLSECAAACGFEGGKLTATALRKHREQELMECGAHPAVCAWFMGREASPAPFTREQAENILVTIVSGQKPIKTSARNIFRGQISKIEKRAFLLMWRLNPARSAGQGNHNPHQFQES